MNKKTDAGCGAVAGQVERPVRPLLLTEKELLDIVDTLIRDRAYNRPAAVAIGMAVGAAVEAEVRERCAFAARKAAEGYRGTRWGKAAECIGDACIAAIQGPNVRAKLPAPGGSACARG